MGDGSVTLEMKKGWKAFQIVCGIAVFGIMGYLIMDIVQSPGFGGGEQVLLFWIFTAMIITGMLYGVIYSIRHRIVFDESGMKRFGVIKVREIKYEEMEELHFSDSFWDFRTAIAVMKNSNVYVINHYFSNKDKAVEFLKGNLNPGETKLVVKKEEVVLE